MGRGLSKQQKTILVLALKNRQAEDALAPTRTDPDRSRFLDIYRSEVLAEVYGFPLERDDEDLKRQWLLGNRHRFRRDEIGSARYNAAQVAVTKAFQRLQQRDLFVCFGGTVRGGQWRTCGGNLTDAGVEKARELTAKWSANLHSTYPIEPFSEKPNG